MAERGSASRVLTRKYLAIMSGVGLILIASWACTSSPNSKDKSAGEGHSKTVAGNSGGDSGPGIDLNCAMDHLQNPPESFHYLYDKMASDHVHQEADLTPQTVDGFRLQQDGSKVVLHATRSDQDSWRSSMAGLTGIGGMSSTVAIINHSSAMQRENDDGKVNGYDTIHYTIDTARFDPTERQMLLSPGEFEKGDAWVTSDGCPVKLGLDSELHRKDGTFIEKLHYEVAMVRK